MSVSGNPKGQIEASVETKLLYQRIVETEPGDDIPYSELSQIVGINVTEDRGRGFLTSARKMAQRENEILTITIRSEGIRHATDEDVVDDMGADERKIHRRAVRTSRKPSCIKDYGSLSDDAKIRHNVNLSVIGAIRQATNPGVRKRLTSAVTEQQQALPVAKTLELFAG